MLGRCNLDDMLGALERMEVECGCELPELEDFTPRKRAQRLLDCQYPPKGEDLVLCQRIATE